MLESVDEIGADYSNTEIEYFCSVSSRFESCRFDNIKIDTACFGGGLRDSFYYDCSFDGCKIQAPAPGRARFERCTFRNVVLKDFMCRSIEFVDCTFSGTLRNSFFNGSVSVDAQETLGRAKNEFHGNNFSGMELIGVDFRTGIDLTQQILPTGPGYVLILDAKEVLPLLRGKVEAWPDSEIKKCALIEVDIWLENLDEGQEQVFFDMADADRDFRAAKESLRELLDLMPSP